MKFYRRKRHVDSHREPHGMLMNGYQAHLTSSTCWDTVPWCVAYDHDRIRWPNATDWNARLKYINHPLSPSEYNDAEPSIGSITTGFDLTLQADSLARNWKQALPYCLNQKQLACRSDQKWRPAPETACCLLSDINIVYQLKQLPSKFDRPTTYLCCREAGPYTKSHVCYPVTVFTLADNDRGRSTAATAMRSIAKAVLTHGMDANLTKSQVTQWSNESIGKVNTLFGQILLLFGDHDSITILDNPELNSITMSSTVQQ
ncbi:hypothetical protein DM01DRAFT_1392742 [Hesseltinella vesiculosa]|uniref:Uncharacterized protein n=1 Tax=Hesseltinella vesiculosa TaxID=101127 RepID=A0A1X2GE06_9FUNG|nr:hypothetical protein DM01DRAFT_1392742 [Hesseltinella vesiculosa]